MTCYVYAIGRIEGPVKVGVSSSPEGRVSALQTGCPFEIRLLHATKCRDRNEAFRQEQECHMSLERSRLIGEWFDVGADRAYEEMSLVEDYADFKTELRS